MQIEILKDFDKFSTGDIIHVKDVDGTPKELFWRNRVKDAEIDGCVKVVKTKKRSK